MKIAIFGLGKMGAQIARRLHKNGFEVLAWNRSQEPRDEVSKAGVKTFADTSELINSMDNSQRVFWLMLPHEIVDEFLHDQLLKYLKAGDIVIDGGNSHYKESIKRAEALRVKGIVFYDCGTSGGVWGEENGFALMVGGPKEQWPVVEPIFKALSTPPSSPPILGGEMRGYGLLGKNGAGHFVKMVHNGIEYGMMEAIGEGYGVLKASEFDLDLLQVTKIYQQGSVVRSWLIDLTRNIFENEKIDAVSGEIAASGEGEWMVNAAKELGVDARVIEDSLNIRRESADSKNQNKFSNKIVALLRKQFGGHSVKN